MTQRRKEATFDAREKESLWQRETEERGKCGNNDKEEENKEKEEEMWTDKAQADKR